MISEFQLEKAKSVRSDVKECSEILTNLNRKLGAQSTVLTESVCALSLSIQRLTEVVLELCAENRTSQN